MTTPTFAGTAEVGAIVTLFDGATQIGSATANGSGNWSITSSTLGPGGHSITARATDAAGNTGVSSSALSVTIDISAPSVPSTPDLAAASDTGTSNTDNVTNVTTPTFTGTAEPGALVTLFDGLTQIGSIAADGLGNWSITSSPLNSGTYSITAKATDAAGNTSAASAALSVTIDTTAPAAPSTPDLAAASDSGTSNTDNITNVTTPTFTGTAQIGAIVTLFDGATQIGSTTADGSGNWSITSSTLGPGSHSITARATDSAGNTSVASAVLPVVVDTAAPAETLAITSIADSSSPTDQTITVSGSNSALAPGDKVQISVDDVIWTDVVQNTATSWSFADSVPRTANFTYRTRIIDIAANVGATATQAVLVANNGGTISVGASSGLVAKFTGTAGGTLQLGPSPGITGTVNAISIASGLIVISGNASVTSGTGDAIDLTRPEALKPPPQI